MRGGEPKDHEVCARNDSLAGLSHRLPMGEASLSTKNVETLGPLPLRGEGSSAEASRAFARRRVMNAQGAQLAAARSRVRGWVVTWPARRRPGVTPA
jgi:hypothetical protein